MTVGTTEETVPSFTDPTEWLFGFVEGLRTRKFYGRVVFEMKAGEVFLIRKEETVKPPL